MPPLTNIFGGDDSDNNSSSDSNILGHGMADVGSAIGLNADSEQTSWDRDEDGSESYDNSSNSLSLDSDSDGLLQGVTDIFNSSDESSN